MFKPAEAISELSTFANVDLGDVLLTVTPERLCAASAARALRRLLLLQPLLERPLRTQARQPHSGDRINARIRRQSTQSRQADGGNRRARAAVQGQAALLAVPGR